MDDFIWNDPHVERAVVEIALASAIINFNNGVQGLLPVFEKCNVEPGYFTQSSLKVDHVRVKQMKIKSKNTIENRRKKLRAIKKDFIDQHNEAEGVAYNSAF